jgi:hypothetical protein
LDPTLGEVNRPTLMEEARLGGPNPPGEDFMLGVKPFAEVWEIIAVDVHTLIRLPELLSINVDRRALVYENRPLRRRAICRSLQSMSLRHREDESINAGAATHQ